LKYEPILGKASFGKRLRINGKLIIKGPGKAYFVDDVRCSGRVITNTHSSEAVIIIGEGVILNGTRFVSAKSITVGPRCILADCRIMDTNFHSVYIDRDSNDTPVGISPVTIGSNIWIGAQAAVLKGASIGENSVVGFGSIVASDLEPNVLAMGNPAKAVKKIYN
jgi:acetyltransferase-like isoleucine patch superfamily enzyme